jgi:hypothetical protein
LTGELDSPAGDPGLEAMAWWTQFGIHVDRVSVEVHHALRDGGIVAILLKGPAVASWLYGRGDLRRYGDSDFLVSPADWHGAQTALRELGFAEKWQHLAHRGLGTTRSQAWRRAEDEVDLHASIDGLRAPAESVWEVLSGMTVVQRVVDADLPVLAPAPRAMHIALHAGQHHHLEEQPREDLRRALEQLPVDLWREAMECAHRLDGLPAFASGLRLVPQGHRLGRTLGLEGVSSVETRLREDYVPLSEGLNELIDARGLRAKLEAALAELVPSPAFMRWWSPLARRGRLGLALAYAWRPLLLARRLPRAARSVHRARRRPDG